MRRRKESPIEEKEIDLSLAESAKEEVIQVAIFIALIGSKVRAKVCLGSTGTEWGKKDHRVTKRGKKREEEEHKESER